MEVKIFGRSLFEVKKSKSEQFFQLGSTAAKESKFLPDFYRGFEGTTLGNYIAIDSVLSKVDGPSAPKKRREELTPKRIYKLQAMHDKAFKLNVDPAHVDRQVQSFKDKLALVKSEEYDMTRGVKEIASIVLRLENRKKYPDVAAFFEQYPYTTTDRVERVVKDHDYLKVGQVAEFLADMPKEAVDAMKAYNAATAKVCGKQAVFYIVANKKDFQKTEKRRDPILLAQSPFGHVWQILGAWDEEMLIVDEL